MIFLDNTSTTKIYNEVNQEILKINSEYYFNPSALYKPSADVLKLINNAKENLAKCLGCEAKNVVFTSGATEANNMAILGNLTSNKDAEYLFSCGEHLSVFNPANNLKSMGKVVKFVNLKADGTLDTEDLKNKLSPLTHFVSVIMVSNETGAINNIKDIAKIVKNYNSKIIFHTDAVQAFGKIPFLVNDLNVDVVTLSAHKFHGPKGVGAIIIKQIEKIKPLLLGGGQQNNLRSGTENTSGYVAMSKSAEITCSKINENYSFISELRSYVKQQLLSKLKDVLVNEATNNSPYILSVSFKGLRGEVLLHMLEKKGVLIGIGSACSSKKPENRVLKEMKVDKNYILGSVRISFSAFNTLVEVKEATKIIVETVLELKEKMGV